MSNNQDIITNLKDKISKEIRKLHFSCEKILVAEKNKLDIFCLTEDERIELQLIKQYVDSLVEPREQIISNLTNELNLDMDFTGKNILYLKINDKKIVVNNMKSALVKFCEFLVQEDSEKFNTIVEAMPRAFSEYEDKSNSAKLIQNSNIYVNTQKNNNALAKTILRICRKYGIDHNKIKIGVE